MLNGIPYTTLNDRARYLLTYGCIKHDLASDVETYVDGKIDRMPNSVFLMLISDALDDLLNDRLRMIERQLAPD
jgi:hypothetical protein